MRKKEKQKCSFERIEAFTLISAFHFIRQLRNILMLQNWNTKEAKTRQVVSFCNGVTTRKIKSSFD